MLLSLLVHQLLFQYKTKIKNLEAFYYSGFQEGIKNGGLS
jgi:hypothetical protein